MMEEEEAPVPNIDDVIATLKGAPGFGAQHRAIPTGTTLRPRTADDIATLFDIADDNARAIDFRYLDLTLDPSVCILPSATLRFFLQLPKHGPGVPFKCHYNNRNFSYMCLWTTWLLGGAKVQVAGWELTSSVETGEYSVHTHVCLDRRPLTHPFLDRSHRCDRYHLCRR